MTNDEIIEIINLLLKMKNNNLEVDKPLKNVKLNKVKVEEKTDVEKLRKCVDLFLEVAPSVKERLQTYSSNSHFGSPSEKVFFKFDVAYLQIKELLK